MQKPDDKREKKTREKAEHDNKIEVTVMFMKQMSVKKRVVKMLIITLGSIVAIIALALERNGD